MLRGLRRERGSAQRHAEALTTPRLKQVLAGLGASLGDRRDRALLLVGTAAALRRSELVALDVADLHEDKDGLRVIVRRSKTDQEGRGFEKAILHGRFIRPVFLVKEWLDAAGITEGALFRPVNRGAAA